MWIYQEDPQENACGKLSKAMYGSRDAALNSELENTELMVEAGFAQGSYSVCAFYHKEKDIRVVVHCDDFTVPGSRKVWIGFEKLFNSTWR